MGEFLLCAEGDCSIVGVLNGLYGIRQQAQQGKHHRWESCDKKMFFFWGGVWGMGGCELFCRGWGLGRWEKTSNDQTHKPT